MKKKDDKKDSIDKKKDEKKEETETTPDDKQNAKIPRNVNYYRHLLEANYINENDINWVLKLRDSKKYNTQKLPDAPYSVYNKFTKSIIQKQPKTISDLSQNICSNVEHLTRHRIGPTQSKETVNFEISLRPFSKDEKLREKERAFTTVAYKDRGEFPIRYPKYKEELVKLRESRSTGKIFKYESGFDGRNNYPPYDLKYRDKNFNRIQHLKNTKLEIGQLKWENQLR